MRRSAWLVRVGPRWLVQALVSLALVAGVLAARRLPPPLGAYVRGQVVHLLTSSWSASQVLSLFPRDSRRWLAAWGVRVSAGPRPFPRAAAWPVRGAVVSAPGGAVWFAAAPGARVRAGWAGRIVSVTRERRGTFRVVESLGADRTVVYAGLAAVQVVPGQQVGAGTLLGAVGGGGTGAGRATVQAWQGTRALAPEAVLP